MGANCRSLHFHVLKCNYAPYGQLFSYRDVTGEHMAVTVADHTYTQRQRPAYNVRVKGIIMHPSYTGDAAAAGFDIALLQLNRAVKPNIPETLMEVGIQLAPKALCKIKVPSVDDYDTVCTDEAQGGGCNGDSGGGLHCLTPDGYNWIVYGIASASAPNCTIGFDVFALTATKLGWINAVMAAHP
ncbi:unnamed protein product [Dibothriocephalus latus]|uniref:Peptidase S1 domain-containing protein n=1 Tax=Dibothriocephalus latus TaxID=60516 RepID=A0A3P7LZA9_DIBLA|nr:unnamed protein product [Dibothriocephalus latus]